MYRSLARLGEAGWALLLAGLLVAGGAAFWAQLAAAAVWNRPCQMRQCGIKVKGTR